VTRPITIADVATRAGVSKSTVSRVLNGRGELRFTTASRVRRVIEELGYVPSARAVDLARGSTDTVGLLVPSLAWPWIGAVLQGVADVLESESYGVLLFTCNRGEESINEFTAQVSAGAVNGLIVIMPEGRIDHVLDLHRHGLPAVLIDDRAARPDLPSVRAANHAGAATAAAHLLDIGRHHPAVITGGDRYLCAHERLAGFLETYADAGYPVPPELVVSGEFTFESGRAGVRTLVAAGRRFDAVFAHNDLSAMGALQALQEVGQHVPDDVAVIGFDDLPSAMHTDPPLTSVRQPRHEMGAAAARMLLRELSGARPAEPTVTLPTELRIRPSTVGAAAA
jgi:LacI family transcriptional regulator